MGSSENIQKVLDILKLQQEPFVVVVSAVRGTTDKLHSACDLANAGDDYQSVIEEIRNTHLGLIQSLLKSEHHPDAMIAVQQLINELESICTSIATIQELSDKVLARVLGMGERLSAGIAYLYFSQEGLSIQRLKTEELIIANHQFLNAEVDFSASEKSLNQTIDKGSNYIAPGFVARDYENRPVVLGRGGSDYTASILGSCLQAEQVELWSDVDGMLSANPNLVQSPISLQKMSYQEAFELAYFGAKVLYPPTVRPLRNKGIPVYLKNTLKPNYPGTLIANESADNEEAVTGISSLGKVAILNISGVGLARVKGTARRVFEALEKNQVNVILISQACSEQSICLAVNEQEVAAAQEALNLEFELELSKNLFNPIEAKLNHAIVAVVGDRMKNQVGLSGKIFGALGSNGVNVIAIAQGSSERNISIVVEQKDEPKAVNVIHENFFSAVKKRVHVFVAGVGNVGKEFLQIFFSQQKRLLEEQNIDLRLAGVANSKSMWIDENGLGEEVFQLNEKGKPCGSIQEYVETIAALNLRHSIFVDNTASDVVSAQYKPLFENSISVVTCNKVAGSSALANYQELKKLLKKKNCSWQYETSVGAALPLIKTIQELRQCGDEIHQIEAVVSGSLNFIFNTYNGTEPFADVVKTAREMGFTEPNPLIDLSGVDVIRKILILAREAGKSVEFDDVSFNGFLPEACMQAEGWDNIYVSLLEHESFFKNLYQTAESKSAKLKVVAKMNRNQLEVSLQELPAESPFYVLEGKDNAVALFTNRYAEQPLFIKGAGAGAQVTASGVFSDVMYLINR